MHRPRAVIQQWTSGQVSKIARWKMPSSTKFAMKLYRREHVTYDEGSSLTSTTPALPPCLMAATDDPIRGRRSSSPKRSVTFARNLQVSDTISLDEYTDEEILACWFSSEEYADITENCTRIVTMCAEEGLQAAKKQCCTRGLERMCGENLDRVRYNRQLAYALIFEEQAAQWEMDCINPERISTLYHFEVSYDCQILATKIGKRDRNAIRSYISRSALPGGWNGIVSSSKGSNKTTTSIQDNIKSIDAILLSLQDEISDDATTLSSANELNSSCHQGQGSKSSGSKKPRRKSTGSTVSTSTSGSDGSSDKKRKQKKRRSSNKINTNTAELGLSKISSHLSTRRVSTPT